MPGRSVYKLQICLLLGMMASLPYLVQSDEILDAIQKALFKSQVTEEESSSLYIPDAYLCDACVALAYSLDLAFQAAVKKNKSAEISETILYAIVDDLCENETHWQTYGLREIEGKKRFAGPGLKAETTFGLNIEGGLWSKKMTAFCWRLLGDKDEHELLETFREGELKQLLCHEGELIYCKSRKISDEL